VNILKENGKVKKNQKEGEKRKNLIFSNRKGKHRNRNGGMKANAGKKRDQTSKGRGPKILLFTDCWEKQVFGGTTKTSFKGHKVNVKKKKK